MQKLKLLSKDTKNVIDSYTERLDSMFDFLHFDLRDGGLMLYWQKLVCTTNAPSDLKIHLFFGKKVRPMNLHIVVYDQERVLLCFLVASLRDSFDYDSLTESRNIREMWHELFVPFMSGAQGDGVFSKYKTAFTPVPVRPKKLTDKRTSK